MEIKLKLPFFKKQSAPSAPSANAPIVQLRTDDHPFAAAFSEYSPLKRNYNLCRMIREAIPICNQAILILCHLIGEPRITVKSGQEKVQKFIDDFMKYVRINANEYGLGGFLTSLADSAFMLGGGVGEIVPTNPEEGDVHHLHVGNMEVLSFVKDDKGEYTYAVRQVGSFMTEPVKYPKLINHLAFDRREGDPYGYSLFYSLPYVVQVFLRLEKAIENNAWRMGDPIFFILARGSESDTRSTAADLKKASSDIAAQLAQIMIARKMGQVKDLYAGVPSGGEVSISTVGADAKIMIQEIHLRTIEEQIVANTGIPPGLLGLSWSSRETMLEQQVDILSSRVWSYREKMEPIVRQIVDYKLLANKYSGVEYDIEWDSINLLNEKNMADARLANAQAKQIEIQNVVSLVGLGVITTEQGNEQLVGKGLAPAGMSKDWWVDSIKKMFAAKMMQGIFYQQE